MIGSELAIGFISLNFRGEIWARYKEGSCCVVFGAMRKIEVWEMKRQNKTLVSEFRGKPGESRDCFKK